jgi:hypothetical protein
LFYTSFHWDFLFLKKQPHPLLEGTPFHFCENQFKISGNRNSEVPLETLHFQAAAKTGPPLGGLAA